MPHQAARRDSKTFIIAEDNICDEEDVTSTPFLEAGDCKTTTDSGALALTDPNTVLLSMSEYDDKTQEYSNDNVYEYEAATGPHQDATYPGHSATHPIYSTTPVYLVDHQVQQQQHQLPVGLSGQNPTDLSHLTQTQAAAAAGSYESAYYGLSTAAAAAAFPAYQDSGPRQLPPLQLTSYSPNQGQQSTKVTVYIRSPYDLDAIPLLKAVVMFGRTRCEGVVQKTGQSPDAFEYAISASAPPFDSATASISPQLPLQLVFEDSALPWDDDPLEFGHFTYLDHPASLPLDTTTSSSTLSKKRKISADVSPRRSPGKRPSTQHLRVPANVPAAPLPPSQAASNLRRPSSSSDAYSHHQQRYFGDAAYQRNDSIADVQASQSYGASPGQATPSMHNTQSPSWPSYFPQLPSNTRSPSLAARSAPSRTPQLLPSPIDVQNPPLIRTSILHPSPSPMAVSHDPAYPPFPLYGAKAELKIEGELETMTKNWTPVEVEAGRRLVQFQRTQTGNVITTSFAPVTLEDRAPNSICVSCIWWELKKECYVTSVDTIALLESLVAVRFTVEEKNRIRRNLEGYRPTTVSKARPDSDAFFKLIMGFPNPKPRNIEKDVKVFPWRILTRALIKIIGKYSASYSSTAATLPGAAVHSGAAPHHHPSYTHSSTARPTASPHSTSSSAGSQRQHAYTTAMMTGAAHQQPYSPPQSYGVSASSSTSHGPRLATAAHHQNPLTSWHQHQHQQQQHLHHPSQQQYSHQILPGAPGRSSGSSNTAGGAPLWDMSSIGAGYMQTSHQTAGFLNAATDYGGGGSAAAAAQSSSATPRMAIGEYGAWISAPGGGIMQQAQHQTFPHQQQHLDYTQQQHQHRAAATRAAYPLHHQPPPLGPHPLPLSQPSQQVLQQQQRLSPQQLQQLQQQHNFRPAAAHGHPTTSTS